MKKKWHHKIFKPKEPEVLVITMNDIANSERKNDNAAENNLDQAPALGTCNELLQPDLYKGASQD